MPVTTRYSASLDRTYEEGDETQPPPPSSSPPPPPPPADPWDYKDKKDGQPLEEGLSDSMDSLALDDDSNSSASGHSRQHSSDGGSATSPAYATRPLATLTPRPPPFNPLQFVKTAASPLVKKAEAQIKQYEEVKKVKELVKEEAEEWQSNLDVWKSRRRLVSQKSVQRVEESKQIEEELDRKRRKSKTFSEMMEERSKRGVSKSLPCVYNADDGPLEVPLAVEEDVDEPNGSVNGNGVDSQNGHKSADNNGHNGLQKEQQLSGFEEAIRSYAEYAEETNSKARTKTDITLDVQHMEQEDVQKIENITSQEPPTKEGKEEKEDDIMRDAGRTLQLTVQLRRQSEHKDFGFNIKRVKGVGTGAFVETVQPQSPAFLSGLQVNDELLAINGERCTADRSHSAIVLAIKQAVYTGQLQLTIYRYDEPENVIQRAKTQSVDEVESNGTADVIPKVDVGKRRSMFERPISPERVILHRRSLDLSVSLKDKVASFEGAQNRYKSTEILAEKETNGGVGSPSITQKNTEDSQTQVGSGLMHGFELASTLQETPIVDSAPNSPSAETRIHDTLLDFDFKEEVLEVVHDEDVISSGISLEPPKEKPPPPPPQPSECDPAADPAFNKTVKLRRVESTKRILKEIHKRRSDFLGIEDDEFQKQMELQMKQVSPPPNVDEMLLKMEKERLAMNSSATELIDQVVTPIEDENEADLLSPTPSSSTFADDIDQKEREIIEGLEMWEEEQKLRVAASEVTAAEKISVPEVVTEASMAVKVVLGEPSGEMEEVVMKERTLEEKELELKQQEERLRSEKEKLRKEQEELMRKKEEYEKEIQKIQQMQMQNVMDLHSEQLPTTAPNTNLHSQMTSGAEPLRPAAVNKGLPPPVMSKPKLNENTSFSLSEDEMSMQPQFQTQVLTKPNLVALSAPPKAKLMDGEEWMQRKKRENYHQHWLVQEAEFRRLQAAAQVKENEKVEDRLVHGSLHTSSKHHVIDMDSPPPTQRPLQQHNGDAEEKTQRHLQKPAPRPPAKPVYQPPPAPPSLDKRTAMSPKIMASPSHSSLPLLNQNSPNNSSDTQILSVSGKKRCSHCSNELGRGAAMIIESLQLFYHIGCFKCCVCHVQLGNGSSGTDVRVRSQKLHCHNCYSNDEGLKFSKV